MKSTLIIVAVFLVGTVVGGLVATSWTSTPRSLMAMSDTPVTQPTTRPEAAPMCEPTTQPTTMPEPTAAAPVLMCEPTTQPTTMPELSGAAAPAAPTAAQPMSAFSQLSEAGTNALIYSTPMLQTNGCTVGGRMNTPFFSPGLPLATCTVTPSVDVNLKVTATPPAVSIGPISRPISTPVYVPAYAPVQAPQPDAMTQMLARIPVPTGARIGPVVPSGSITSSGIGAGGPAYPNQWTRPYYTPAPFGWVGPLGLTNPTTASTTITRVITNTVVSGGSERD